MSLFKHFRFNKEKNEETTTISFTIENKILDKLANELTEELSKVDIKDKLTEELTSRVSWEVIDIVGKREAEKLAPSINIDHLHQDIAALTLKKFQEEDRLDDIARGIFWSRKEEIVNNLDLSSINPQLQALLNQKIAENILKNWGK